MHTCHSLCTRLRLGGYALTSLALTALASGAVQAQYYSYKSIAGSGATGVNNSGQVTGTSRFASPNQAYLTGPDGGLLKSLGVLPGDTESFGRGVNASGQVVGNSDSHGGGPNHAFLSGPNGGTLVGFGSNSYGAGINDSGQITGSVDTQAFLTGANGVGLSTLGVLPGGTYSGGAAVNVSGQVVGEGDTTSGAVHAFLSGPDGGALQDLGVLPGYTDSYAYGVNAAGQVAGKSGPGTAVSFSAGHAFLSGPGGGPLQDLGTLPGGTYSTCSGINASGQVAGSSDSASGQHAFLFSNGVMTDLNSLIGSGFPTLLVATSISDNGYIVGVASGGVSFLLTPVPETSSLVSLGLLTLGLGGVVAAGRRKRPA